jgi:hypothetical protein
MSRIIFNRYLYKDRKKLWNIVKYLKKDKPLLFIHTPKCSGSYAKKILTDLKIEIKGPGHKKASKKEKKITFSIFRHPVDRFESFLNFRLQEQKPRKDWPKNLNYAFNDKNVDLNEIVFKLSKEQIIGFHPFKTLEYWFANLDIVIKVEELKDFLLLFDYKYDEYKYEKENISLKTRGTFNTQSINKLNKIYNQDIMLYNRLFPND